jgi:RNA methyltransferase, TrmH family
MITSTSNPRIKVARKLHQKRHRDATRQLLLEGVRLIDDAFQSGVRPVSLFFDTDLVAGSSVARQLLRRLEASAVDCFPCTPQVIALLAQTVTPQGLVAVVPWPKVSLPPNPTLTLLLDGVREPGNAGTLMRTAEAAGVDQILFGPGAVDPFNDKVVRAAMGSHFRLPFTTCRDWESVAQRLPDQPLYLADAHASLSYDRVDWRRPSILVVGGEAAGSSVPEGLQITPVTIPMCGRTESLNAAVAGAVILFEAARQRRSIDRVERSE